MSRKSNIIDYPKNLLVDLYGEDEYNKIWKSRNKFDIDITIRYILNQQCNKYIYEALLLRYTTKLTEDQISEMYNISKSTVILHIKRAKEILSTLENKKLLKTGIF